METFQQYSGQTYDKNIINEKDIICNQPNNLHISVIKPITKKIIRCTDTKVNVQYKPVEMVEEVNTYIPKEDKEVLQLYKTMQEKKNKETEIITVKQEKEENEKEENEKEKEKEKDTNLNNKKSFLSRLNFLSMLNKKDIGKKEDEVEKPVLQLFQMDDRLKPRMDTVFVPKFEKNVEVVSHMKENINVDYTYMIPKPVIIPVEVPVLKYKDNFKIVPIKKKIIPIVKYTDETIYVDCFIEKPYLVVENIVIPVPCDAPIEVRKYLHKAPPVVEEKDMTKQASMKFSNNETPLVNMPLEETRVATNN